MRPTLFILLFITAMHSRAQDLVLLTEGPKTSLRGLSVVNDKIIWVSGSAGTVGMSSDAGKNWHWSKVSGYEDRDFRDIEAFDRNKAIIMAVGSPAVILRTKDGGRTWKEVFRDERPEMFLDAMHFWNINSGIVIGDPVDGRFFVGRTFDGGETWSGIPSKYFPVPEEGEACFAASGTNIRGLSLGEACFITGGKLSRFFSKNDPVVLPLAQGSETMGANSIAVLDEGKRKTARHLVVVGGDFLRDTVRTGNAAISEDGGKTWTVPEIPPFGYRSSVEFLSRNQLITCGTSGVDFSNDGGRSWINFNKESFHVVRKAKKGKLVILAGKDGRIASVHF